MSLNEKSTTRALAKAFYQLFNIYFFEQRILTSC